MPVPTPMLLKPAAEMPFKLQDSSGSAPTRSASFATACRRTDPCGGSTGSRSAAACLARRSRLGFASHAVAPPTDSVDAETRYALGMAYKDMGLLEEAKEEFLLSMKDSGFFVDSCLMMGLCVKEQGQSDQAIQLLEKLIADSRCRGGNAQLVRYELGLLYEKMGSRDRAIAMYQSIPSFHDVPRRLESLHNHSNGVAILSSPLPSPRRRSPLAGQ